MESFTFLFGTSAWLVAGLLFALAATYDSPSMETDLLKTFASVADARSFSKAAEQLYSTQSTVSRQIARLEEMLDARLFVRYGRHVELTTAGELLLPLANAIVTRTEDAVGIIREQAGGGPSTVHFGAVPMVMAHILIPLLAPFIAAYPGMTLDLTEKDDAQLEEAVISGQLDCGVMTPWGSSRVSAYHLLTEEMLLVVPREHPLAALASAPFSEVAAETILLPRATLHVSNLIVEAFRKRGLAPKFSSRCNYPELNKELVRKGLGIAPMPITLCSPAGLEGLAAIPFEEPLTRDLHLIYPQDRPLSAAARALIAYIRTHVPKQRLFEERP